ncbi:MAG: hypothetical protein ACI965_002427 [Paraglaciecola sp.]|jgi:hypothetical protein
MVFIKTLAAAVLCGVMFSSQASVILINDGGTFDGTDVGMVDTLLGTTTNLQSINGSCPKGSSEKAELCWATSLTNVVYSLAGKQDPVQAYTTDKAGVLAFQLAFGPGTYIVKNSKDWALFTNLVDAAWGVIDTADLGGFNLSDTQLQISHITEFDSGGGGGGGGGVVTLFQAIPEPASLFLFTIAVLGLGGIRLMSPSNQ